MFNLVTEGNCEIPAQSKVTIHYNGYFEGESVSFDSTYMRGRPLTFDLGQSQVLFGLEKAVETMKNHEESEFIISWQWLYGEIGKIDLTLRNLYKSITMLLILTGCPPRIKPKADALFIIRVVNFKEASIVLETSPGSEITQFHQKFKNACNFNYLAKEAFKRNNVGLAISNYLKAVNEIDKCPLKDANEEKVYNDFLTKAFLNLAVCYNNHDMPKKACSMINNLKPLGGFDGNAKALYQEGKALTKLGNYDRARTSLMRAKRLAGDDINIDNALKDLDEKAAKYREEERRLAQNALGMLLKSTIDTSRKDDKSATDEASSRSAKSIQKFIKSDLQSLLLPNNLSDEELAALRSMETKMGFKLSETETMSGKELRLVKLKQ